MPINSILSWFISIKRLDQAVSLSPPLPVLVSHRGVGVSDSVGVVSGRTVSGAATFNSHWDQFQVRGASPSSW